jgi:hypothetical protein
MSTITEANNLGDLLKYEAPNRYSRDVATIAAGQNLPLGTVLGRKTDDGKHYPIDPAATDGTETAIGVLANEIDATNADRSDAILIARHAIVAKTALVWPIALTGAQRISYEQQLADRGVLVRDSA